MKYNKQDEKSQQANANSYTPTKYYRLPPVIRAIDPKFRMVILWSLDNKNTNASNQ